MTHSNAHILIVDDETDIRTLLSEILEDEGYRTSQAAHSEAALHILEKDKPNLIILDIWLDNSDMDGMEILAHVKNTHPEIPVLMISGHGNIEMAVKAMKLGAYEFIEKPFNSDHLLLLLQRALEAHKLRSENIGLKKKMDHFESFTATDPASIAVKNAVEKAALTQSRVMVSGPSGCGKTLVCQMIHANSAYSSGPFIVFECATLSVESPERQKEKILEAFQDAQNGSLVLQNVHEMPLTTQAILVNILQDTNKSKSVRTISTANYEILQDLIKQDRFKEDLFYRLNIVHIELPALKDRKQDINELTKSFLSKYFEGKGRATPQISGESLLLLTSYQWPGNIRQLKNIVENIAMTALSENATVIEPSHLPSEIKRGLSNGHAAASVQSASDDNTINGEASPSHGEQDSPLLTWLAMPMKDARNHFEKYYLDFQTERFSGQISKVAQFVGMDRTALHRKLKTLEDITSSNDEASKQAVNDKDDVKEARG